MPQLKKKKSCENTLKYNSISCFGQELIFIFTISKVPTDLFLSWFIVFWFLSTLSLTLSACKFVFLFVFHFFYFFILVSYASSVFPPVVLFLSSFIYIYPFSISLCVSLMPIYIYIYREREKKKKKKNCKKQVFVKKIIMLECLWVEHYKNYEIVAQNILTVT